MRGAAALWLSQLHGELQSTLAGPAHATARRCRYPHGLIRRLITVTDREGVVLAPAIATLVVAALPLLMTTAVAGQRCRRPAEGPAGCGPSHLQLCASREWAGGMRKRIGAEPAAREPASAEEIARYVVAEAVWAPSVHNTQPWRFVADGRQLSLYADADRGLPVADPDGREMMISCGAALFTVRLALRSLGYIPQVRVLPDPGQPTLVAQVSWRHRAPSSESEQWLASQVHRRRTHRGAFDPEPLPHGTLAALRETAARDGVALRIMADDGRRAALAAAVETAERVQRLDAEHVRELARWAPAPDSTRSDGVPVTSYPARPERTDPYFPGRDFAHGHSWGIPPLSSARLPRATGVVGLLIDGRRPPGGLGQRWTGAAADLADREHLRCRGGAAQPAGRAALAARLHPDPPERRRLPASRAQDRDGHPGGGQRAARSGRCPALTGRRSCRTRPPVNRG